MVGESRAAVAPPPTLQALLEGRCKPTSVVESARTEGGASARAFIARFLDEARSGINRFLEALETKLKETKAERRAEEPLQRGAAVEKAAMEQCATPRGDKEASTFGQSNLASPISTYQANGKFVASEMAPLNLSNEFAKLTLSPRERRDIVLIANLYASLLIGGFVEDTVEELRLLFRCLEKLELAHHRCVELRENDLGREGESTYPFPRWESNQHWATFLGAAINDAEPLLSSFGTSICGLLVKFQVLQIHGGPFVKKTLSALSSFDTVDHRKVRDLEDVSSIVGFAMPFQKDLDSRLNFRTRELSRLYCNRESVRDSFLGALRVFREVRSKLESFAGSSESRELQELDGLVRECFQSLLPANLYWFAQFFVSELLQICSVPTPEPNAKVRELAKDAQKLSRLQRRFSSALVDAPNNAAEHQWKASKAEESARANSPAPRVHTLKTTKKAGEWKRLPLTSQSPSEKRRPRRPSVSGAKPARVSKPAYGAEMQSSHPFERGLFVEDEEFFHVFIATCDSHRLNSILQAVMISKLKALNSADDILKTATMSPDVYSQRVIVAKLLGKFLGYLLFSPNWFADNEAFGGGQSVLSAACDINAFPVLDVLPILKSSCESGILAFSVPWVRSFLAMTAPDRIVKNSTYFAEWIEALSRIYWRQRRETTEGLFISLEIEHIFNQLGIPRTTTAGQKAGHGAFHRSVPSQVSSEMLRSALFSQRCWLAADTLRAQLAKALSLASGLAGIRGNEARHHVQPTLTNKIKRKIRPNHDVPGKGSLELEALDRQLVDSFLHQNPHMKKIVEFCAEILAQKALNEILEDERRDSLVRQAVRESLVGGREGVGMIAQHKARVSILQKTCDALAEPSKTVISLCCPSKTDEGVIRAAVTATLRLCEKRVEYVLPTRLTSLISEELRQAEARAKGDARPDGPVAGKYESNQHDGVVEPIKMYDSATKDARQQLLCAPGFSGATDYANQALRNIEQHLAPSLPPYEDCAGDLLQDLLAISKDISIPAALDACKKLIADLSTRSGKESKTRTQPGVLRAISKFVLGQRSLGLVAGPEVESISHMMNNLIDSSLFMVYI